MPTDGPLNGLTPDKPATWTVPRLPHYNECTTRSTCIIIKLIEKCRRTAIVYDVSRNEIVVLLNK